MMLRYLLPAMAAIGLLAGCGMFGDDQPETAPAASPPKEGEFPNLGSVPQEAPPSTPKVEREKLIQGLQADKANAEYSDEKLGEETANVPPAEAPPPGPPKPEKPKDAANGEGTDDEAAAADGSKDAAETSDEDQAKAEAPPPPPAPTDMSLATALIYFGESTAELTDFDRSVLADVASMYVRERGKIVHVVGHTSGNEQAAAGTDADLAKARADAVAQTLISLGVSAKDVVTSSGGSKFDESNPNGIAANRRVEIYIGA